MISIVILGSGNVANHLYMAIKNLSDFEIIQIYGRNRNSLNDFGKEIDTTTNLQEIKEADLYIIAISDDAISDVSSSLIRKKGLVVHTSGSKSIEVIEPKRRGVFYPLQTFSVDKTVNFKEIPICLETDNEDEYPILERLATSLSRKVLRINSNQRKSLHLAAVFANNFTNHLYQVAAEICEQNKVPFDILKPLIQETADKINHLSPKEAQTGPAKRNDKGTIKAHKNELTLKKHRKIYSLLSKSIRKTYGKKL